MRMRRETRRKEKEGIMITKIMRFRRMRRRNK